MRNCIFLNLGNTLHPICLFHRPLCHKSKGSPEKCIGCERVHIKWSRSQWAVKCNKKDIYFTFIHNQLCCRIQICHKWVKESDISGICWFMYTRYFQDRCELFWSQWKYTAIGTDIYYFLWKRKKTWNALSSHLRKHK